MAAVQVDLTVSSDQGETGPSRGTRSNKRQRQREPGSSQPGPSAPPQQVFDLTADDDDDTLAPPFEDDVVLVSMKPGPASKKRKQPANPLSFSNPPPPPPPDVGDSYKCPICLEKLDKTVSTPCGHLFCGECLSAAMKVNKKCPKCRKGITPGRVHRVFFE